MKKIISNSGYIVSEIKFKYIIIFLLVISVTGCISSKATSELPSLEKGSPTGTVYVGYIKKILPSGTRVIILDDEKIFTINSGQYTKFNTWPGKHNIRVECVTGPGSWSDSKSNKNNTFNLDLDGEIHYMVQFDTNCKKYSKSGIKLVTELATKKELLSYKYFDLNQKFYVSKKSTTPREIYVCCEISGKYKNKSSLKRGVATIEQDGANVVIHGNDLLALSIGEMIAQRGKPYKAGPPMKVVGKIDGKDIKGEWWYLSAPENKLPFKALIGKHAGVKGYALYIEGDMSGILLNAN